MKDLNGRKGDEWIKCSDRLPENGYYLVRFLIEVLGIEKPFEDTELYAEGYFDPESGWKIENRYIHHYKYEQPYISNKMRVTHWMPLPKPPEHICSG